MDTVESDPGARAEAEQQVTSIKPKIALAQQEVALLAQRVEGGVATPVSLAEAKLRRLELETALSKAELDLAVVRRRIAEHRGK
jgi:outer membrane protein TolC